MLKINMYQKKLVSKTEYGFVKLKSLSIIFLIKNFLENKKGYLYTLEWNGNILYSIFK